MVPDQSIFRDAQAGLSNVSGTGQLRGEHSHESVSDVFVEEQLHATELATRHSRAAAQARAAPMSACVRSGKLLRI